MVDLSHQGRGRDEIDQLLDDVFGEADQRGPGPADAVLVIGGVGAIAVGQIASLPTPVSVCGGLAAALGAVLPARSLWRRIGSARRARRLRSMLGEGRLLRTDHPSVERLLAEYRQLWNVAEPLATTARERVHQVAHAALVEVASLLGGRRPLAEAEIEYVDARVRALEGLAAAVVDPRVGDGEMGRRRAHVEARHEVEQLTGRSSLTEASELSRELLGADDI